MSLSAFSVRRYQFTIVVFLMTVAIGISSLFAIPKAEDPTFPFANFAVIAVYPGASPRDLERLVVDPIETKLKALDDVKVIKTTIEDGLSVVQIEFVAGKDPDRKRDEVLREINALRPTLPADLARLDLRKFNAAQVNVRQVALVSATLPYRELEILAKSLQKRLESLKAVGEATIAGLPKQEIRIAVDLPRLSALGISPAEIMSVVQADSANIPAGAIDAGARRYAVKTSGDYRSPEEVGQTVVRMSDGGVLRVSDVATVSLNDVEATHLARYDGERAVLIAVNQREGQNILTTAPAIEEKLDAFEKELPAGVVLKRGFDQSANVRHRLAGFSRDFVLAIALVLLTLLPLGTRASLVVMVSIPLSLASGVALLHAAGYSINQLSIVGFVIALGLLVDDSVVVVENITRFLRQGYAPKEAAILATRQITVSVLGCTATLIFAFLPLLFLPGAAGLFIRSLPLAVVFTIVSSLFVSLTIVPFLASLLLKPAGEHGNVFFRAMTRVIEGSYRPVLALAVRRPLATLGVATLLFAGSLALVPRIGFSLFPKAGIPQFLIDIQAPEGASFAETLRVTKRVEAVLAKYPRVRHVTANIGKGNPQIYYNVASRNEKANVAEVFAEVDGLSGDALAAYLETIRRELATFADARVELKEFENGPPLDAPIAVRLLSEDPAALVTAAGLVEATFAATPGTRDVRNPSRDEKIDLRVVVDRDRAALHAVAVPDVDRVVRLAVGGVVVASYREEGSDEARDIRVTARRSPSVEPGGERPDLAVLAGVFVPTQKGSSVPLASVARLDLEASPTAIRHHDKERSATVSAFPLPGFNTDRVTKEILARLEKLKLPRGVRLVPAGEIESRSESFGGLGTAILVAAFGVLAVLVLEFRTFRGTAIVASVIPLGVIGGLAALYLTGNTLSFTANIGFVALMGIEVKNSILLVDFTNELRAEGVPIDEAIRRAGETRFVPILLTTLTAVGGLLPLALEKSPLYSPLAIVILGGLLSSTVLTRVVTPVLYKLLAPEVEPGEAPVSSPPSASEGVAAV